MRVGLPWMTTSWPGCCLSFETSAARSPVMSGELFHSSFFNVFEATYLGMLLNRSAKPSSSFRPGQAAANPSYVTRPRRSASVARSSSNLNFPVSSLQNGKLHLSGASTTPSKVMNNVAAKVRFAAIDFPSFPFGTMRNPRPVLQPSQMGHDVGFRSRAEFVTEATRAYLRDLRRK